MRDEEALAQTLERSGLALERWLDRSRGWLVAAEPADAAIL